jgi:hypothetical protein
MPELFAIFLCLEISIPTFETIQPSISFQVLPLLFNHNSRDRRDLLILAIPKTLAGLGHAMSQLFPSSATI